jgi:hypothetical protein
MNFSTIESSTINLFIKQKNNLPIKTPLKKKGLTVIYLACRISQRQKIEKKQKKTMQTS